MEMNNELTFELLQESVDKLRWLKSVPKRIKVKDYFYSYLEKFIRDKTEQRMVGDQESIIKTFPNFRGLPIEIDNSILFDYKFVY